MKKAFWYIFFIAQCCELVFQCSLEDACPPHVYYMKCIVNFSLESLLRICKTGQRDTIYSYHSRHSRQTNFCWIILLKHQKMITQTVSWIGSNIRPNFVLIILSLLLKVDLIHILEFVIVVVWSCCMFFWLHIFHHVWSFFFFFFHLHRQINQLYLYCNSITFDLNYACKLINQIWWK